MNKPSTATEQGIAPVKPTLADLGRIMLASFTTEQIRKGYRIDPSDAVEIGRQALAWGDINADGTLN